MRIPGHTFLVTGAASGLGAGTARMFAEAGGNVLMADMNALKGQTGGSPIGLIAVGVGQ